MNEQQVRVGVGVIVMKDGRVLLGKRKGSHGTGTWAFPGGHLEFGESFEDCARREVYEETGVKIHNIKKVTFTNDPFPIEGKHYVTCYVKAEIESGEVVIMEPNKCEVWDWFKWGQFPEPLFIPLQNLIKEDLNPVIDP
jgi:8-oxo-dGTP diphosphatase